MLFDQNNWEYVIDVFRFDVILFFFQRLVNDMNIVSGCLFFCFVFKMEVKNFYVWDDVIFIKVIVDLIGF